MKRPPRQRLQLDERRAQLLALGLRLFTERTFEGVSIDDIAEAAGVSKGLLYHYFGSKRAFYVETVRAAAAQIRERAKADDHLPHEARAVAGIGGYLDFVEEHAAAFATLLRGGVGHDPEVAAIVEEARLAFVERILGQLGLHAPRPVFRFAMRSWIGLVEAASLEWIERREVERDVVERVLLESLQATLATAMRLDPESPVVLAPPPAAPAAPSGAARPTTKATPAPRPRAARRGR